MSVFPPLETQNAYPQAVTLSLDLRPHPNGDTWAITAQLNRPEQWLTLLSGCIRVSVRRGILNLQGQGGTLTQSSNLPSGTRLLYHTSSEARWQIDFSGKPTPLTLALGCLSGPTAASHWQATLILTPADLAIADSQGLWPPDLSPNQLAIADRLIAQFLVQSCFPGALSCCQWAMADVLPDNLPPTPWDAKALAAQETDLGDRLQVLNQATSTDLLSLTRLVGLDSQQDLAGGKFVGVNLSGIDLSGANLANSNFRGAILTDADLSGANLAGSSLRGADLSGAYLEGANLTQVDFRKASLALTNMIGADLTGANLHGTALNNANWSRANLNLAQIGDNAGLSQTQQANLIERGAKLSAEFGQEMLG